MSDDGRFGDWIAAPNIVGDPETYELENEAIERDGRLDRALAGIEPWDDRVLVDIGCGTGFWLPRYAERAHRVVGVEPDPQLLDHASRRIAGLSNVEAAAGSAEHIPLDDSSADIVHARFAYFFGEGADLGLAEVARVLRPDGVFIAIDNSWSGGDFARLLRLATGGNADINPGATERWWADRGATRHEIEGGWATTSESELERILRIEFSGDVVEAFLADHDGPSISYHLALYEFRPAPSTTLASTPGPA